MTNGITGTNGYHGTPIVVPSKTVFYLAAPYSSPDKAVTKTRVREFCRVQARLNREGLIVISPLLNHLLVEYGEDIPTDWHYWQGYSEALIERCDALLVLHLDGWELSAGVTGEILEATVRGVQIVHIDTTTTADAIIKAMRHDG